jgi:hypothetical protein
VGFVDAWRDNLILKFTQTFVVVVRNIRTSFILKVEGCKLQVADSLVEEDLCVCLSLSLILQPTVSRPVWIKHPYGAYDQIFITVRQLLVSWSRALSLTRGRVCRLQLLLVLASAVIFGSDSRGTRDRILLSQIRDFPFFSSPPTTRRVTVEVFDPASTRDNHVRINYVSFIPRCEPNREHYLEEFVCYSHSVCVSLYWSTLSNIVPPVYWFTSFYSSVVMQNVSSPFLVSMGHTLLTRNAVKFAGDGTCLSSRCLASDGS